MNLFHDGVQVSTGRLAVQFRTRHSFSLHSFSLTMSDPTLKKATYATTTVKFNVGGRLYEVPRSLVEKFPSTMLARMASDTWQKVPEATLFIGRSGERFEYSLDYMRGDKVWLPLNIPKEAFLDDLDFYGFEDVDPRKIHGGSSHMAAVRHLFNCKEEHEEFLSACKRNVEAAERTRECEEVAYACFARYSRGKSLSFTSTDATLFSSVEFHDHLAKYGLVLVKVEVESRWAFRSNRMKLCFSVARRLELPIKQTSMTILQSGVEVLDLPSH
jgi:hypothetical protein